MCIRDSPKTDGFTIQRKGRDSLSWRMYVDDVNGDLHFYTEKAKQPATSSVAIIDAATGAYLTLMDANLQTSKADKVNELENILKLKPISYKLSEDDSKAHLGFTGENMQAVYPDLVKYDEEKKEYYLNYSGLNVHAIKAMQKQKEELEALQGQVQELKQINEELIKQLNIMIELTKDETK